MRLIGSRLPILAVLVLAVSSVPSRAQVLYLETADWIPTASVLALPTSYVVAGTYAVPTSYAIPTVYATAYVTQSAMLAPTTYVAPTYYETRFRRRGLFGRRLVETTRAYYLPTTTYYPTTYYYPTTFYSPTVLDTAVVSTGYTTARSSDCCGGEMIAAATPEVRSYASEQAPVAAAPAPGAIRGPGQHHCRASRPRTIRPTRTCPNFLRVRQQRPSRKHRVRPPADVTRLPIPRFRPVSSQRLLPPGQVQPRPSRPHPRQDRRRHRAAQDRNPQPGSSQPVSRTVEPPTAPAGVDDLQPAPGRRCRGRVRHQAGNDAWFKSPFSRAPRALRSEYRNVLFGRVKARDTNEPEEGVRVTISNRTNAYADRVALTDAFGRFAVKVPDGDWTVNVTMPSGRAYSVSQITVSNGLISDDIGRDIPSLVITR